MNIISQKHHQNENYLKNLEKKLSENEQKTQKNQNLILQKRKTFKEDFVKPSNTHRNISFIPNSSQKPHNNNNVYAPKLNPTSQLMLDRHMLLKYRIFQGTIDSSILNRYKKISVTRAGKFTATKFSDEEGSDQDDIELFKQVPALKEPEVKGFRNYCESFIQDNKL